MEETPCRRRRWIWGQRSQPPDARALGNGPPALKDFAFFLQNNLIFLQIMFLKRNRVG